MEAKPVPFGFGDIEEWILHQLFEHPKASFITHTLFQQLDQVLQSEPSQRDTINQLRAAIGNPPLGPDEYVAERKLEFSAVEWAVETLIEKGWAKGDRNSSVDGVYYTDLKLTTKGEAEAIRRKRERLKSSAALSSLPESIQAEG